MKFITLLDASMLQICRVFIRPVFGIKFMLHGSRFRVNVPHTWKLKKRKNVFFDGPVALRKNDTILSCGNAKSISSGHDCVFENFEIFFLRAFFTRAGCSPSALKRVEGRIPGPTACFGTHASRVFVLLSIVYSFLNPRILLKNHSPLCHCSLENAFSKCDHRIISQQD
jgi:hypothetical protein